MPTTRRELLDRARLLVRQGDYREARVLVSDRVARGNATEAVALAEIDHVAAALLNEPPPPAITGRCNPKDPSADDAFYYRALRFYISNEPMRAEATIREHEPITPYYTAAFQLLRGWCFAARSMLPHQLAVSMKALRALLDDPDGDSYLIGNASLAIATLAREMPSPVTLELLSAALTRIDPAAEARAIVHVRRALAMIDALHGRYIVALTHLSHALQYASDGIEHAFVQFDYATIAAWAKQSDAARAAFDTGYDLVHQCNDLSERSDESLLVLTVGATAGASVDRVEAARECARRASREVPRMSGRWRNGGVARLQAYITETLALTDLASVDEARAAVDTFERLGYYWRAGRLCLHLYERTGHAGFHQRARRLLEQYGDGPLKLDVTNDGELLVSPRQRQILAMLQDGRSPQSIANELQISVTTVRKHIQNLHERLGVHHRGALIAKALAATG